ncbi:MAG TPA: hypothetical protein VM575_06080 [Nocardioides sp.]|nr:hypothetical protein [Nocardioides sp.]
MILALWLLAGVLFLLCGVGYSYRRSGPAGLDPKEDVGGLLSRWLWTATLAVALIAAGVTIERTSVSSDELQEAAADAAARVDHRLEIDSDLLEIEIADELGSEVTVTDLGRESEPDVTTTTDVYLVTAGDEVVDDAVKAAESEDAVCVKVSVPDASDTLPLRYQLVRVDSHYGTCDS